MQVSLYSFLIPKPKIKNQIIALKLKLYWVLFQTPWNGHEEISPSCACVWLSACDTMLTTKRAQLAVHVTRKKTSQMPKPTTILNWTKQIWTDKTEKRKSFRTRLGLIKHIVRVNIDSSLVRLAENCRSNVSASSDNCCLLGWWMAVLLGGAVRGGL